ncbi:MAG TPA: UDP-N-acetylmuramoyl-tripeptide--D-alanyl-D-alanine ligase [Mycobacteriales bacterium]|nr:UDP-N-acetylmuramoyl-tripeptide--D-alanyl-D-alanine ligase [Mycobacteriales bacterium]
MIPMSVGDVAALTGGRLDGLVEKTRVTGPVVVDSRQCTAGSLFVCLTGEHTDGHLYAGDAYRRGAVAAIAGRPVDGPSIMVDDTLRSLGFLAGGVLRRTTNCRVIGVTGSSGKTSTKDIIAAMLTHGRERLGETVAAQASLNNEVGLPLTVLGVEESTRHLVCEYSARGVGHIAYLCGIARPAVAVVLNVGSAHLGGFGSREAIAAAKGELVEALAPDGLAVLCVDDPLVAAMRGRTDARVVGFGHSPDADVRIESLQLDGAARPRFRLATPDGAVKVRLQLSGAHQASNAAAAAAVGLAEGMRLAEIAEALGEVTAVSAHRMQVGTRPDGLLVVDDAYNANPESVRAALESLAVLAAGRTGSSWAVLGEMRELGGDSAALHAEVGRQAASLGVDRLVVVGEPARRVASGAHSVSGWRGSVDLAADAAAAAQLLAAEVLPTDVVLVKASNALRLWEVAEGLLASDQRAGEPVVP